MIKLGENELKAIDKGVSCVLCYCYGSRKKKWESYGINSLVEQINIMIAFQFIVREINYIDGKCSVKNIIETLQYYIKTNLGYDLNEAQVQDLVNFMISEVFAIDDENWSMKYVAQINENKPERLSYLLRKNAKDAQYGDVNYYRLSDFVLEFLVSLSDIQKYLSIDVSMIIFLESLEKKNFEQARIEIQTLYKNIGLNTEKLKSEIERHRQDPFSYEAAEYRNVVDERYEKAMETLEKIEGFKERTKLNLDKLEQTYESYNELTDEGKKDVGNLRVIQEYIDKCIRSLSKNASACRKYNESVMDLTSEYLRNIATNTDTFGMSEVYNYILKHPKALFCDESTGVLSLLQPLIMNDFNKVYNPELAFNPTFKVGEKCGKQKMPISDDVYGIDDDETKRLYEQQVELIHKPYRNIVKLFLKLLMKYESLQMDELIHVLEIDEYEKMCRDIDTLRMVLCGFLKNSIQNVELNLNDLDQIYSSGTPIMKIDVNEELWRVWKENNEFKELKTVRFEKLEDSTAIIRGLNVDENSQIEAIELTDFLITATFM